MKIFKRLLAVILVLATLVALRTWWNMSRPPFPATGELRKVERLDTTLSYFVQGAGDPIVLLASAGRPASDFNLLAAELNKAGYRTIAIDPRGTGASSGVKLQGLTLHDLAKDVDAVISAETKPDERIVILGHAFGNREARVYATDYPQRTRAVILLAAGGKIPIEASAAAALHDSFLTYYPDFWRRGRIEYAFFAKGNPVPDAWIVGWSTDTGRTQGAASKATPSAEWWAGGNNPMLIVQGMEDRIAPAKDTSIPLKQQFGDRVVVANIAHAAHALLPEQPAAISSSITAFLKTLPGK